MKIIKKCISKLGESLDIGTVAIKENYIRDFESIVNIIPLLIFIEGLLITLYGAISFAKAGGFSEQLKRLKEVGFWHAQSAMINDADTILFYKGLPVIILNILLIIAIICFAIEFYKGKPLKIERICFEVPIGIGLVLPAFLVLVDKIQRVFGAKGLAQGLSVAINKRLPEDYVQMVPSLIWKNMFFFGFLIVLLGSLILLTNKNVRTFFPNMIMPLVSYFLAFPFLLYIIENALAVGAVLGGILIIIGGLIVVLFIAAVMDTPTETRDDALRLLQSADEHDRKAAEYGIAGRMLGFAADERREANLEREHAKSILRKLD